MSQDFEEYSGEIQRGLGEDLREAERPRLETFSAYELQHMVLPPVQWLVDGLIVRGGLGVLAAPPKYGKSWMCLDLCTSIATGRKFLGFNTWKARPLYLALEDSKNRLQARQNKQLAGRAAAQEFDFSIQRDTTDGLLFDKLETYCTENPDTALIVIDTLQKVRSKSSGRNMYAEDYGEIGKLKSFADAHNLTILLVHHLRKMGDESDPFNRISGSTAIMGAADFAFVLTKSRRQDDEAILTVTGRDVEEEEFSLHFDKEFCTWQIVGTVAEVEDKRVRAYYTTDPIVLTVKSLLKADTTWTGSTSSLKQAVTSVTGFDIPDSERAFTEKVRSVVGPLEEYDGIKYERKSNGSGGGKHHFWRGSA